MAPKKVRFFSPLQNGNVLQFPMWNYQRVTHIIPPNFSFSTLNPYEIRLNLHNHWTVKKHGEFVQNKNGLTSLNFHPPSSPPHRPTPKQRWERWQQQPTEALWDLGDMHSPGARASCARALLRSKICQQMAMDPLENGVKNGSIAHRIHVCYIYGNIYHQYTPNVSIYTIHGSYGLESRLGYLLEDLQLMVVVRIPRSWIVIITYFLGLPSMGDPQNG